MVGGGGNQQQETDRKCHQLVRIKKKKLSYQQLELKT